MSGKARIMALRSVAKKKAAKEQAAEKRRYEAAKAAMLEDARRLQVWIESRRFLNWSLSRR